jgi:hypothetical protein
MGTLMGMQPTTTSAAASVAPLIAPWMPGPHDPGDATVVVSVTDFQTFRRRELPGIAVNGLRMRMGWYAMPGAVGLWLWSLPATSRSGSISVWASEDDLQRFVGLPHHIDIMKRSAVAESFAPRRGRQTGLKSLTPSAVQGSGFPVWPNETRTVIVRVRVRSPARGTIRPLRALAGRLAR